MARSLALVAPVSGPIPGEVVLEAVEDELEPELELVGAGVVLVHDQVGHHLPQVRVLVGGQQGAHLFEET